MKNFEELMAEGKSRMEARRDELIRKNLLSDEFLELIQKNKKPFDLLMSYYQCAIASVDKGIHNKTTKYGLPTY